MSDKDFKVKNKLVLNGLTQTGPLVADSNKQVDATPYLTTLQGGTGTTTSPSSGQILYSSSGTTYAPTTLSSLDVKGATYSADAPSSPFVGQVWVESDSSSDSFDPNIIRRKSFTATAGQTVFTTDLEFIQGYEQVFFNGMLLLRNSDYTTASNTNVTLASGAAVGDIVEIVSITNLNSINTATTTTNTFTGRQTVSGGTNGIDIEAAALIRAKNGFRVTGNNGANEYQIGPFYNFTDFQITHSTDGFATHNPRLTIDPNGNVALSTAYTTLSGTAGNGQWRIRGKYTGDAAPYQSEMISSVNWNTVTNTQDATVNGSAYTILGGGSNGYSAFSVYTGGNASTPLQRFIINSEGNVGVGNYTVTDVYPMQRLDVDGNINMNTRGTTAGRKGTNSIGVGDGGIVGQKATMSFVGESSSTYGILTNITFSNFNGDFYNSGLVERMRINSTGYLLVGYTASQGAYRLQVNSQIFATSSSIATSDGRYKENVNTITGGLDIVDSLRPVSFTWKEHPVHNFVEGKTVGFIAQEVRESLSQYDWVDNIIKTNTSDAILDEDGNEVTPAEEFLGIAESNIIPLLVAAVKELKTRVEALEAN